MLSGNALAHWSGREAIDVRKSLWQLNRLGSPLKREMAIDEALPRRRCQTQFQPFNSNVYAVGETGKPIVYVQQVSCPFFLLQSSVLYCQADFVRGRLRIWSEDEGLAAASLVGRTCFTKIVIGVQHSIISEPLQRK